MYTVWLGRIPVRCDYAEEALALCRHWRKIQNQQTDADCVNSMHQPVFVD